jgi:hypothetical protein
MPLFGKDPWQEGVRASATIERVVATAIDDTDEGGVTKHHEVFLTFQFTDEQGAVLTQEGKFMVGGVPQPGSIVDVAYIPGKPKAIDYDVFSVQPPDPSVPRGWGAGIFEVEDLGSRRAHSPFARGDIDRKREVFRTGQRMQAEIVSYSRGLWVKRGVHEYTFVLRANGQEFEAKAWTPASCLPQPGDVIQVAVNGSEVVLDSDERYDGPPGQALVFTTPPEIAAERERRAQLGPVADAAGWQQAAAASPMNPFGGGGGMLDMQVSGLKAARDRMGSSYEAAIRLILDQARASGSITDEDYDKRLRDALA